MNRRPFYFEIKDLLTQFVAAFDDVVIGRFNKEREERDRIKVRYLYAPKQRVLYDIINQNKTITLPVVSITYSNLRRDVNRVFNKIDGFFYSSPTDQVSSRVKTPIPVNLTINMSIISRYQTDMDQILSNFIPFCNPYVVISWKIPQEFNLKNIHEIRSTVMWNEDVSLSYPTDTTSSDKYRITADTSFTLEGWLFKDNLDLEVSNIYYIDHNYYSRADIDFYDNYTTSQLLTSYNTDQLTFSGSPYITNILYNNVELFDDLNLPAQSNGQIILKGYAFNHTHGIILSSSDTTILPSLTSIDGFSRQPGISGYALPNITKLGESVITFMLPALTPTKKTYLTFVPYNSAGYTKSNETLFTNSLSSNTSFIVVNPS